jgi:MFS family permease
MARFLSIRTSRNARSDGTMTETDGQSVFVVVGPIAPPEQRTSMSEQASIQAMERNVARYPVYAALYNAFFWMPVFFLFFGEHLPLAEILSLEGIYYAAVVLLEVPSGYFSDRVGRKATLLVSSVLLVVAYVLFFLGAGFTEFAIAQVLLAGGIAFNSGTDTSFHYDSLASLGRESEYEEREAIVARNGLAATGVAALLGGLAATLDLRWAYGLSALTASAALVLVFSFHEPGHDKDRALAFLAQLRTCVGHLRRPALLWLFGFAVLSVVLNHVPYEFYQPYLDVLGADVGLGEQTPFVAGLHMAVATLIASGFARRSARIDARLGTGRTLLLAAGLQVVIIAVMGSFLHIVVVGLILLRGLPGALSRAPLNAAITPRIPMRERATYLSIQSLVGRLAFSGLLAGLSVLAGDAGIEDWPVLSSLLLVSALVGGVGWLVLVVALRFVDLGGTPSEHAPG